LEQRIKEELEANPALEEGEDRDEHEAQSDDDTPVDGRSTESEEAEKAEEPSKDEEFELDDYLTEYIEDDPSSYKLKANLYSADEEGVSLWLLLMT